MQIHAYYRGFESAVPAVIRKMITECELIEEYHWTFQEVMSIPMERLNFFLLWKRMKYAGLRDKEELEEFKKTTSNKNMTRR